LISFDISPKLSTNFSLHGPPSSHSPLLDYPNNMWQKLEAPYHTISFFPLRPWCSSQRHTPSHPLSMYFP